MITTILIVLVAVVVLIVIIAVLALRYLRADDSDTFDDIPDEPRPTRRPPEPERESLPTGPQRRQRPPEQATEVWGAGRRDRAPESRGHSRYPDRDTGPRQPSPERVGSQAGDMRREPALARSARGASRNGAESATSSWDSLSDVDYWAELAADKPQITPAAGASAGRRRNEPGPESRQPAAARSAPRGDPPGQLPRRKRDHPSPSSQPSPIVGAPSARPADPGQTEQFGARGAQPPSTRYGADASGPSGDPSARRGGQRPAPGQRPEAMAPPQRPSGGQRAAGPRAAQPSRPSAPIAAPPYANGRGRADDDPLTSPSFPAVNSADSRSYRTRRSGAGQSGTSGQHSRPPGDPGVTGRQFIEYSSAPSRATSRSDSHPGKQPATAPPEVQQAALQAGQQHQPAAPAANPYGSYVTQPEVSAAEAAYQPAGYPATAHPSLPGTGWSNGYASGPQAAAADWYPATNGGLGGPGPGGSHSANGSNGSNGTSRSYPGIDYSRINYDDPVYPDGQGALAGYGGQHDQQGRGGPNPGYSRDTYQGYPGYGGNGR